MLSKMSDLKIKAKRAKVLGQVLSTEKLTTTPGVWSPVWTLRLPTSLL